MPFHPHLSSSGRMRETERAVKPMKDIRGYSSYGKKKNKAAVCATESVRKMHWI